MYQVKEEIGLFKDAKTSANEFKWEVDVADEKRYDEIRRQYDSYFRKDQRAAMQKMTEQLVSTVARSSEESDDVVLDVATGMGAFIVPFAEKSSNDTLIIGTDIDEKPLRGTMKKARGLDVYHKTSLIVTDAKHLCFRSSCFSTISSNFGLDNVPETRLAFIEAARVLVRRGKLIFTSLWLKENSESMRLAKKHHVAQIASETGLRKALKEAGLGLDSVEEAYRGVWPHNPMDLLPVEGDEYTHVIVQASKSKD
jgi:ubiquinone/menaquinone biosynthesis C-methylase UbiE